MNTTSKLIGSAPRLASFSNGARLALPLFLVCVAALTSSAASPTAESLTLWYALPAG